MRLAVLVTATLFSILVGTAPKHLYTDETSDNADLPTPSLWFLVAIATPI
jgi:hypothetical protein